MPIALNPIELRVLGSLIEKEITTPAYYPLTLNSLTAACNQKNNRDPVVTLEEEHVVRALDGLRERRLVATVTGAGIRVPKYRHTLESVTALSRPETAILCLLLLRGPQTTGELRSRSAPLFSFSSIADVETALASLEGRPGGPLVTKLPRQPGHKESRFMHLLADEPAAPPSATSEPKPEAARMRLAAADERLAEVETRLAEAEEQIRKLLTEFATFKKQFE
jgi:uncharacterized protein YceH (UPF0502 family)